MKQVAIRLSDEDYKDWPSGPDERAGRSLRTFSDC